MKAFHEWWKTNKFGKNNTPGPKDVWRAALKYVLTLETLREKAWVFDYIREELSDD